MPTIGFATAVARLSRGFIYRTETEDALAIATTLHDLGRRLHERGVCRSSQYRAWRTTVAATSHGSATVRCRPAVIRPCCASCKEPRSGGPHRLSGVEEGMRLRVLAMGLASRPDFGRPVSSPTVSQRSTGKTFHWRLSIRGPSRLRGPREIIVSRLAGKVPIRNRRADPQPVRSRERST